MVYGNYDGMFKKAIELPIAMYAHNLKFVSPHIRKIRFVGWNDCRV